MPDTASKTAAPSPLNTTKFWRALSQSPGVRDAISEWLRVGLLALVQVHGSIEDERMFSAMTYLMSKYRNRLKELHLNVAAHLFGQDQFAYKTFPYDEALTLWHAGAPKRGRYRYS